MASSDPLCLQGQQDLTAWLEGLTQHPQLLQQDLPGVLRAASAAAAAACTAAISTAPSLPPELRDTVLTCCSAQASAACCTALSLLAWAKVSLTSGADPARVDLSSARALLEAAAAAVRAAAAVLRLAQASAGAADGLRQGDNAAGQAPPNRTSGAERAQQAQERWRETSERLRMHAWTVLQLLAGAWSAAAACFGAVCGAPGGARSEPAKQLARAMHASGLAEALSAVLCEALHSPTHASTNCGGVARSAGSPGAPGPAACAGRLLAGWSTLYDRLTVDKGAEDKAAQGDPWVSFEPLAKIVLGTFQGPAAVRLQALLAAAALRHCCAAANAHGRSRHGHGKSHGKSLESGAATAVVTSDSGSAAPPDIMPQPEAAATAAAAPAGAPEGVAAAAVTDAPSAAADQQHHHQGARAHQGPAPPINGQWLGWPLSPATARALGMLLPGPQQAAHALRAAAAGAGGGPPGTQPLLSQEGPQILFGGVQADDVVAGFLVLPLKMWQAEYRRCAPQPAGQQQRGLQQQQQQPRGAPLPHLALPAYLALMGVQGVGTGEGVAGRLQLQLAADGARHALAALQQQQGAPDFLVANAAADSAGAACCLVSALVDLCEEAPRMDPDLGWHVGGAVSELLASASEILAAATKLLVPAEAATLQALDALLYKMAECSILPTLERGMRLMAAAGDGSGGGPSSARQLHLMRATVFVMSLSRCGLRLAARTCQQAPCCSARNHHPPAGHGGNAAVTGSVARWPTQRAMGAVVTMVKLARGLLGRLQRCSGDSAALHELISEVLSGLGQVFTCFGQERGSGSGSGLPACCPHALALLLNLWPEAAQLVGCLCTEVMEALTPRRPRREQGPACAGTSGPGVFMYAVSALSSASQITSPCLRLLGSTGSAHARRPPAASAGVGAGTCSGAPFEIAERARAAAAALQVPRLLRAFAQFLEATPRLYAPDIPAVFFNLVEPCSAQLIRLHQQEVEGLAGPACAAWLLQEPQRQASSGSEAHAAPGCSSAYPCAAAAAAAAQRRRPPGCSMSPRKPARPLPALLPALMDALHSQQMPASQLMRARDALTASRDPRRMLSELDAIPELAQELRLPPPELLASHAARRRLCCNTACRIFACASEQDLNLRLCGGCRAALYCSVRCQAQHWEAPGGHRGQCAAAALARACARAAARPQAAAGSGRVVQSRPPPPSRGV